MLEKIRKKNRIINLIQTLGILLLFLFILSYLSLKHESSLQATIKTVETEYNKAIMLAQDLLFYSQKLNLAANEYLSGGNSLDLQYYINLNNEFKGEGKLDYYLYSTYYFLINHQQEFKVVHSYYWKKKLFQLTKVSTKSKTKLISLYYNLIRNSDNLQNDLFSLKNNDYAPDSIESRIDKGSDTIPVLDSLENDSLNINYYITKVSLKDTFNLTASSIKSIFYEQNLQFNDEYLDVFRVLQNEQSLELSPLYQSTKFYYKASFILGLLFIIVLGLGFMELRFAIKFYHSTVLSDLDALNQLDELQENNNNNSSFAYIEALEIQNKLKISFVQQNKLLNAITNLATKDYEFTLSEEGSKLDTLIQRAVVNVKNLFLSTKEVQKNRQNEIWINEALATFNEVLRQISSENEKFYLTVLKSIIKSIGANQGGVFVLKTADNNDTYLELQASYAYNIERKLKKEIMAGDGVLGNLIYEKAAIYLQDLPKDYVYITSGIGQSTPNYLYIQPLLAGNTLIGAIEIASFSPIAKYQQIFIGRAAENLSSVISTLINQAGMESLLAQSKLQSETMAVQEEELRQNLEELKATEEEILRKELDMKNFEKQLSEAFLRVEIDKNFRFLNANPLFLKTFNLKFMQISELSFTSFLSRNMEEMFIIKWRNFLRKKHPFKLEGKFIYNQHKARLITNFIPVIDSDRNITKIIILAVPIEAKA